MNDGLLRTLDPAPAFTPEDAATSEALLTTILAEQVPSGRRPARLVLAAAAAVLAVAGVVWGANLGRPALVAAPTPAPTGRTTPTPTATPSGPVTASAAPSSAWPTPTLSCSDFRAAWRAAFASRIARRAPAATRCSWASTVSGCWSRAPWRGSGSFKISPTVWRACPAA